MLAGGLTSAITAAPKKAIITAASNEHPPLRPPSKEAARRADAGERGPMQSLPCRLSFLGRGYHIKHHAESESHHAEGAS